MDLADLEAIAEKERAARKPVRIRCCTAAGCMSSGSTAVIDELDAAVGRPACGDKVEVCEVGCLRLCCEGPLVQVDPDGPLYERVRPEQAAVDRRRPARGGRRRRAPRRGDPGQPFFARQTAIVLENSGRDRAGADRVVHRGRRLSGAARCPPRDDAGRGRRGDHQERPARPRRGRLPDRAQVGHGRQAARRRASSSSATPTRATPAPSWTAASWRATRTASSKAWPSPAYAVGANQGYIYVRGEYPLAIHRLDTAIKQAKQHGLLGSQIFESPFDFKIDIRIGAGAFVCGEETALMALDRGPARHAPAAAALPGRRGPLGLSRR